MESRVASATGKTKLPPSAGLWAQLEKLEMQFLSYRERIGIGFLFSSIMKLLCSKMGCKQI